MARRYWPGGDPIGARIRMGANLKAPFLEIIGVVGDVRNDPARADAEPMAYRSSQQAPAPFASVLVRTQRDPLGLVRLVERELSALDTGLALQRPMTLSAPITERLVGRRLPVLLMTAFGALALLLASVGVYAVLTPWPRHGSRVRRAHGARLATCGDCCAGLAAECVVDLGGPDRRSVRDPGGNTAAARRRLRRAAVRNPLAIGAAVAILIGSATLALLIPLRRAVRVDPATALRAQ